MTKPKTLKEIIEQAIRKVQGIGNNVELDDTDKIVVADALSDIRTLVEGELKDKIVLNGHREKESDFWITVHLPNSGIIFDFAKRDILNTKQNLDKIFGN